MHTPFQRRDLRAVKGFPPSKGGNEGGKMLPPFEAGFEGGMTTEPRHSRFFGLYLHTVIPSAGHSNANPALSAI